MNERYLGSTCPVCGEPFTASDDIVVCPACGTPHHRICYERLGECRFTNRHPDGYVWQAPQAQEEPHDRSIVCPRCGTENAPGAFLCQNCGMPLSAAQQPGAGSARPFSAGPFAGPAAQVVAIGPDDPIDSIPARCYARFIGPNPGYFITRFHIMSSTGRSVIPNFSALFFGPFYYIYRKLYKVGVPLLLFLIVSLIPSFIFAYHYAPYLLETINLVDPPAFDLAPYQTLLVLDKILRYAYAVVCIALSLFANKLYFSHCKRGITQIQATCADHPSANEGQLYLRRGGVDRVSVFVLLGAILVAWVLISYFIALTIIR